MTDQLILDAINTAFEAPDEKDEGTAKRMGTNLAIVILHGSGCTAAHIGDLRPSDHLYVCSDGMPEQMEDSELVGIPCNNIVMLFYGKQ